MIDMCNLESYIDEKTNETGLSWKIDFNNPEDIRKLEELCEKGNIVKVIRCKDCKYYSCYECEEGESPAHLCIRDKVIEVSPEGYCDRAEKRYSAKDALNDFCCDHNLSTDKDLYDNDYEATIKEALHLRIPKKPVHKEKDGYVPSCPNCGWIFYPVGTVEYCSKCGQAIEKQN